MATNPMISMASACDGVDAILANLNYNSAAGNIKIWTGSMPTSCSSADSGTRLATLTLSVTAFGAAVNGAGTDGLATATANSITSDTNAGATGTAGYFRGYNSNGDVIIQGTVGTSAADMILNTTSIVSGATVSITSWTVSMPDGSGID